MRQQTISTTHRGFAYNSALKKTVQTNSAIHSDLLCRNCWDRTGLYGRPKLQQRPRYRRGDDTSVNGCGKYKRERGIVTSTIPSFALSR